MKIHEYQAKQILKEFNVPIQDGHVIEDTLNAKETVKKVQNDFGSEAVVVKAQIHAGGRGKAGGVKFCTSAERFLAANSKLLLVRVLGSKNSVATNRP